MQVHPKQYSACLNFVRNFVCVFVAFFFAGCAGEQVSVSRSSNEPFWHGIDTCEDLQLSLEDNICARCHAGQNSFAPEGEMVGTFRATAEFLLSASHAGSSDLLDLGIGAALWQEWEWDCPDHIRAGANP